MECVRNNPQQRDFFFLFVGGGEKWPELLALREAHGSGCVAVRPYVADARLPALMRAADFGLVALERGCVGLMSPSKIHGYLAMGKPLIYLGPPGSNVAEAIEQFGCGVRADEADAAGLAGALAAVAAGRFDYAAACRNAARAGRRALLGAGGAAGHPWLHRAARGGIADMTAENVMLVGGVGAFLLTVNWVRNRDLREKYAVVWMLVASVLLFCGLFPDVVMWFANTSHLSYPAAVLFVALAVMYFFSFTVSVSLTRQYRRNVRLTQELALLELRLRRLEALHGQAAPPTSPGPAAETTPAATTR